MMEIETYLHLVGMILTVMIIGGYLTYRYFKKRKKK